MLWVANAAGQTMEPERDLSVRGGRRYTMGSVNSTRDFYTVHGTSKAAPFLLKPSGTAILLSEMDPNMADDSWRCAASPARQPPSSQKHQGLQVE